MNKPHMSMSSRNTLIALALAVACASLPMGAAVAQSTGTMSPAHDTRPPATVTGDDPAMMQSAANAADPVAVREPGVPDPAVPHPELRGALDDFGGMAGMTALMDDFMAVMLDDPRMNPFFVDADKPRIKRQLAEQFCVILGGDCIYSGRDMKATHASLGIDKADFNALVEDLQIAMAGRNIPFRSQNKLIAKLAPMHREIINR